MKLAEYDDFTKGLCQIFERTDMRTKEGIESFHAYIDQLPGSLGNDPFPLFHTFAGGMYSREIHIPAGHVIVGKLHNKSSMVYMIKGKVIVSDINGVRVVEGPCKFESVAGLKRVGYSLEDCVWIDIHQTEAKTVEEAEAEIFSDHYSDYELMCEELGVTPEQVRLESEATDDIIITDNDLIYIKESEIEGNGVFARQDFKSGELVGDARIGYGRAALGRYTNHSDYPNCGAMIKGGCIRFYASDDIDKDEEITVNYREIRDLALELDVMLNTNPLIEVTQ